MACAPRKVGFDRNRACLAQALYHPQHFQLIVNRKPIAAFDLDSASAHGHYFRSRSQADTNNSSSEVCCSRCGRVEDSTSSARNFFVAQAFDPVYEFSFAACRQTLSACADLQRKEIQNGPLQSIAPAQSYKAQFCGRLVHRTEVLDQAVPRDAAKHFPTPAASPFRHRIRGPGLFFYLYQAFDIGKE